MRVFSTYDKIGKLTFIKEVDKIGNKRRAVFICPECSNEYITQISHVKNGASSSCGCTRMIKMNRAKLKHGATSHYGRSREYSVWSNMIQRCYNPKNKAYKNYGARGIAVCDEWRNSFENFISDMGECPINRSIDRIENDKGYYKENCRWATLMEQLMNRRNTKLYTYKGQSKALNEWAQEYNIKPETLFGRINYRKMPMELALNAPLKKKQHISTF